MIKHMANHHTKKCERLIHRVKNVRRTVARDVLRMSAQYLREELSFKYIKGQGIEIGALQKPLPVSKIAHVTYVDRHTKQELEKEYPELDPGLIAEPDVLCDGSTLHSFADSSLDFVISNHFLEHLPDPLKAFDNWFRVLRPGGILYLAVPDMLRTFDVDRPLTSLEHMIGDSIEGKDRDPRLDFVHYLEWVTYVYPKFRQPIPKTEIYEEARRLQKTDYSIHFHVFVEETLKQMLTLVEKRTRGVVVEFHNDEASNEFISIMQKTLHESEKP